MSQSNSSFFDVVKATTVGGAVFLIPGFLAVWVLAKIFGLLKQLASSLGPKLGVATTLGGVMLDVVAIAAILIICLLAGLIAQRATAQRVRNRVDNVLLGSFPGYAFVKGLAENIQQSEAAASGFIPVLVTTGDCSQVAFETDRIEGGAVAVYLPGAPNPWSGNVIFVRPDQVKTLPVSVPEALKILRTLGRGSEALTAAHRALAAANTTAKS